MSGCFFAAIFRPDDLVQNLYFARDLVELADQLLRGGLELLKLRGELLLTFCGVVAKVFGVDAVPASM